MNLAAPASVVWRNPLFSPRTPEWVLAMQLFLLHFVWEMLQSPFFAAMPLMAHWPATLFCAKATIGDVAIGVGAFTAASLGERHRGWFLRPGRAAIAIFVGFGLVATVALELHAVYWAGRWSYSPAMPVLPGLGVGLVPLVQWIVIPPIALFLLRRHHLGVPRA